MAADLQREQFADYATLLGNCDPCRFGTVEEHIQRAAFAAAKQAKQDALEAWYTSACVAGYDTGMHFFMRVDLEDQLVYTRYKVYLDAAIAAGLTTLDSVLTIYDTANEEHELTVQALFELFLGYGAHCETLYRQNNRLGKAIQDAETTEELNAIVLPIAAKEFIQGESLDLPPL